MSTPSPGQDPGVPAPWEALLRQLLGPEADAVIAELSERGLTGMTGMTGPDGAPLDLNALASAAGLPTLGICLGAQLLAVATGGRVQVAAPPGREAGVIDVHPRPEAAADALLVRRPPRARRPKTEMAGRPGRGSRPRARGL